MFYSLLWVNRFLTAWFSSDKGGLLARKFLFILQFGERYQLHFSRLKLPFSSDTVRSTRRRHVKVRAKEYIIRFSTTPHQRRLNWTNKNTDCCGGTWEGGSAERLRCSITPKTTKLDITPKMCGCGWLSSCLQEPASLVKQMSSDFGSVCTKI